VDAEQLINVCDEIVAYFDATKGHGHTKAMMRTSHQGDFAVLTVDRDQSVYLEQQYGVVCIEMDRLSRFRGARLPLLLDNYTVRTLLGLAARFLSAITQENRRLAISMTTQHTINGDLRAENERLRRKIADLELQASPGWAANPPSSG
jgi:hypothetical protein